MLANQRWRYRPYDDLSRQLVGGVIVRMVANQEHTVITCQVPDTQHALLAIELRGGCIDSTEKPVYALPAWARVIEWVDSFPEATLVLGLVGGSVLRLSGDRLVTRWVRQS